MTKEEFKKAADYLSQFQDSRFLLIAAQQDGTCGVMDSIHDSNVYEMIFRSLYEGFDFEDSNHPLAAMLTMMLSTSLEKCDELHVYEGKLSGAKKFEEFCKGHLDGLTEDEVNKFLDLKVNQKKWVIAFTQSDTNGVIVFPGLQLAVSYIQDHDLDKYTLHATNPAKVMLGFPSDGKDGHRVTKDDLDKWTKSAYPMDSFKIIEPDEGLD